MSAEASFAEWKKIQSQIAGCSECLRRWPNDVLHPLQVGEIPDPPETVKVLFVGVAPTPHEGKGNGSHLYSSAEDLLRLGLFRLLEKKFPVSLVELGREEGNRMFHRLGCFFVHAAKIRPMRDAAPPVEAIRFCARQHLRAEILSLRPRGICFLGTNNAGPAAEELFGETIGSTPALCKLDDWSGWVAVAHQPRRGWEVQTAVVFDQLWILVERAAQGNVRENVP